MKINNINDTNFKAVNPLKAQSTLFERLNSPKRQMLFEKFLCDQANKSYDLILSNGTNNRLTAEVVNKKGETILTKKESRLSIIFDFSPIRFLENVSKKADKYCK